MTKVLHLIDSSGFYGAERVVVTLLEMLRGSDFPGVLGCFAEGTASVPLVSVEAERRGVPVVVFRIGRGFRVAGVRMLRTYLRAEGMNVVHSHGYKPDIYFPFLSRQVRKISTVHGWSKSVAGPKLRLYERLDAVALRAVDKVVAVSDGVRRDLAVRGVRGNVEVIHNGIALPTLPRPEVRDAERARLGIPGEAAVLGVLGRLVPIKGLFFLLNAMPAILRGRPDCHLCIAGEGPLRGHLQDLASSLGLSSRVHLTGYTDNPGPFLAMIDIFVMPSLSEGLPIALLEAMAHEIAVVASSVGGIPELVSDGHNGLLVEAGSAVALASAVAKLLYDSDLSRRLAHNARKTVVQRFSASAMAEGYLRLYRNVATAPRSGSPG